MGSRFGGDDDLMADINITPFVDIILVVLIIFMVTATTIVKSSIKVTLPQAANAEATETTSLGLTLTADGKLLLDGKSVASEALGGIVAAARKKDPEVVCLIAADRDVSHGRVVWLLDTVKAAGVTKFALNIDKANEIPPDPATVGR
jgi:biopolymer transport protein ExbD